ncbi:unnamed protein product [Rotaria socialis]|uniref:Uncharacterized protein n=1 Tax=Rotaria socialis TaxID=392032 RepID=A0A820A860_9BILA|nr:unnamed protein product [Rotaria socialis]CAF3469828.1 unnamed protein product [Rotaria socialis]CAF3778569.1 unnamed protein product [Rotaria socialis]CAF4112191.1 unnamed protein product [Rotaria socialis]CAF4186310.1 unnamed protein product [Rotaria socialis]
MLGWLRDALSNTSPSLSYRQSMIPSPFFCQQQQQNYKKNEILCSSSSSSSSDDDETTDEESNDNSFYHNPYHSSGQMNYIDVPQQQYTNEHTYPTYLAQQQTSNVMNQSIDDQIHTKLLLLQQRGNQYQPQIQTQFHYTFNNETLSTTDSPTTNNRNIERININDEQFENENDIDEQEDDYNIPTYYSDQDSNLGENFDFASVVLWYRHVMKSVKKIM